MRTKNIEKPVVEKATEDQLLTVLEVASILRVDDSTVKRWIRQGALEAVMLPHTSTRTKYRIRKATVDAIIG